MTLIGELSKLRFVEPNLFVDEVVVAVVVVVVVVDVEAVVHLSNAESLSIANECFFTFLFFGVGDVGVNAQQSELRLII